MQLVYEILLRIIRWYIDRIVCLHFCAFKEAGSDLMYTHVHILTTNAGGVTGLGHDDHTNNTDDGHVTVSGPDGVTIGAENDDTMKLREVGYLATAYFHEADGECPEGFRRIKCRCRTEEGEIEEVWVCYSMDHDDFERWYEEQKWPDRTGVYRFPSLNIAGGYPEKVECGKSITLYCFTIELVANCADYGGAAAGNNLLIQKIEQELRGAASRISCEGQCNRSDRETWRGWMCEDKGGGIFHASAAMQWEVRCE